MPDEKLHLAADEIKAVLQKYDIAGITFIASPTHTEFVYELPTTWNLIRDEAGKGLIRILYKAKDATPEQKEALRLTVGCIAGLNDAMRGSQDNLTSILVALGKSMDIKHWSQLEEEQS